MKRQKMTKMKQKEPVPTVPSLLNLIYPPKCGICGKLNENFLCNKCYKILENDAKFSVEKMNLMNIFICLNMKEQLEE